MTIQIEQLLNLPDIRVQGRPGPSGLASTNVPGQMKQEKRRLGLYLSESSFFSEDTPSTAAGLDGEESPPLSQVSQTVFRLKGYTSRILRKEFEHLRRMPSMWTTSYFASTAGAIS